MLSILYMHVELFFQQWIAQFRFLVMSDIWRGRDFC